MESDTIRILLVEDEAIQRLMINETLLSLGYEVIFAENGHKAWEIISQSSSSIDLVLLDLELEDMDGLEILSKIKESEVTINLPIVICSAHKEMDKVNKSLRLGAANYLVKPIKRGEVQHIVEQIIHSEKSKESSSLNLYDRVRKLGSGSYAQVDLV